MTSVYYHIQGHWLFLRDPRKERKIKMLTSIAIIILLGLFAGGIFKKIHLPYIIGMLLVGILVGPYVLNVLDSTILDISGQLRKMALIIILLKAGLSLNIDDLKRVGRPAVMMCFIPATLEILAFVIFAPSILHISIVEAGIIGAVMGAVSPAVIVPRMSKMIDQGIGTKKGIPQMIIAGSSADDVYVIVIFSALLSVEKGGHVSLLTFANVPVSIVLGILLGIGVGYVLVKIFIRFHMRDTVKALIMLSISFLFVALEDYLDGIVPVSGLLGVMSMGIVINFQYQKLSTRIIGKFSKLWVGAEIFLFVLVGATVNISYVFKAGIGVLLLLALGLIFRLIGTYICVVKTELNRKERIFCMISQIPKATVQAAIGGVPLAMGLACGELVLTMAVISILITAPLGAFAIDHTYKKFLE